ncbi:MAG: MarR family winged helix-turn-helix transcriptional regulator [Acidimicrobiales bacterium]
MFSLVVADVFDAAGALRRAGEAIAATAGQTQARWQLMSVVSVGEWTVPMAAERLGTSRQAVQRIANELVGDGLAAFLANPRHRRSPFLRLSRRGADVLAAITEQAHSDHAVVVAGLPDIDLAGLRSGLQRLTQGARSSLPQRRGVGGPVRRYP